MIHRLIILKLLKVKDKEKSGRQQRKMIAYKGPQEEQRLTSNQKQMSPEGNGIVHSNKRKWLYCINIHALKGKRYS